MRNTNIVFLFVIVMFFASCNSRASLEEQADERLTEIEQLIEQNAWSSARLKIDSIHLLYPRLVSKRKTAVAFADTITRRESARTLAYCDSILPLKQAEADSLQRSFRFEKEEKYQEIGNFVYKSQITEQNMGRNYLKCYVDEKANLYLVSNVSGTKLNHRNLTVAAGELSASTTLDSLAKGDFHSFTTDGQYFESITFTNAEGGIIAFVATHSNEKIKVSLLGTKTLEYILSEMDKKAFVATYHLWILKKDIVQLEKEILKAKVKIGNINLRHSI